MAISDDVHGIEITITVDEQGLKEYVDRDLDEDERTTTRYIEAKSGATFGVRAKVSKNFAFLGTAITVQVYVDGERMDTLLIMRSKCRAGGKLRHSRGHIPCPGQLCQYRFAVLETVRDGRKIDGEAERCKDLGQIVVDVRRRVVGIRSRDEPRKASQAVQTGDRIVSEKALKGKALSHHVQLERAKPSKARTTYKTTLAPNAPNPVAVFVFKYRSTEALKMERIIQRTPSPQPLDKRKFEELTAAEKEEVFKQFQAQKENEAAGVHTKREGQDEYRKRRRISRLTAGSTQLELDEKGGFRQSATPTAAAEREIIEID